MNASEEKILIRKYLLRELSGKELEQLEERFIIDDTLFNQMLAEEEGLIDEYVSEIMTPQVRESFERSYLATPEGREQVGLARSLFELASSRQANNTIPINSVRGGLFHAKSFPAQFMKIAASIIILCGLGFVVWRVFIYESDIEAGMIALNTYKQRVIEVRVTGIEHSRLDSTRGAQDTDDTLTRNRAKNYLSRAVLEKPSAESHHALGRFFLMEKDFDLAIKEFNEALSRDERNPEILSDLGAALLEKGKAAKGDVRNREEAFLESLKHLNKAIELDDDFSEALFNRGLLYKERGELELAIADWERFLKIDPSSGWSEEVKEGLKQIKR